ncbi:MAG: aminotransferase class I/II-fold pyridoxal phosphate-dependent enzyme [Thermodesulfobacteriota bacterium]
MEKSYWSESVNNLRFSVIRGMSLAAADMDDVINLGIGEPDFNTPEAITRKAFADALNGHTHYTSSQGDPLLLDKLSKTISDATGIDVPTSSILITHGGMGGLASALKTILNPGEQVILLEPHFPDYMAHVALAGGNALKVPTKFEDRYIPRPEEIEHAITATTRAIILNSPNNPTGAVIPGNILDSIAKIAVKHDLLVISDEVYDQILYEPPFESIYTRPGMAERTLVIKSFSKSHAMTGWRIGYCFGPAAFIGQMLKVVNYSTACANSISQRAAIAALDLDPTVIEQMKKRFADRIDMVCSRLKKMKGIRVHKPKGSFYILADISGITKQSQEFANQLLQQARVVVIPGYAFGQAGEGTVRIACTHNSTVLSKGMDRIELFLKRYLQKCP